MLKVITDTLRRWHSNSLYRNSMFLLMGTFFMSGTGFLFWLVASRLYSPEQIGLTTTFISAVGLVTSLAVLGTPNTLIRFLPSSKVKERKINTAITIVAIASVIIGGIYLAGLHIWSNKLLFLISSPWAVMVALAYFVLNTVNNLTDSVFISFRESQWVLASNVTQSLVKFVLLFILPFLGLWGLTGSVVIGIFLATIVSLALITIRYKVSLKPVLDTKIIKEFHRYSLGNHLSAFISSLPTFLMPIIITQRLGAADTAYYYVASMFITLIGFIPSAISRSNFAEGSHADHQFNLWASLRVTLVLLTPVVIGLIIFGQPILHLFGKAYSDAAFGFFKLSLIAVLIASINYQGVTFLLVNNLIRKQIYINAFAALLYLGMAFFVVQYGLYGLGWVAIITQSALAVVYISVIKTHKVKT